MKNNKIYNTIMLLAFILILCLPIIFFNKASNKVSVTENRYLASFPKIFNEYGEIEIVGLRSGIESWLNDNIGFRDQFVKLHTKISFDYFNMSPSEKVEIGKDGWYFYTRDNNIDIARGSYPLSEDLLINIARKQEKISEYFKNKGIEYVLILPPSKVSIYFDKLNSGAFDFRETPVDILANYLKENTSIKVISVKDSIINAKQSEQVFYKTDTHWNEVGAYVAYKTIIEELYKYGLTDTKPVDVEKIPSQYLGEFSAMMGDTNLLGKESSVETQIINSNAKLVNDETVNKIINNSKCTYSFENNKVKTNKTLLFGDSMFASFNMPELLAENFSTFTYIWSYEIIDDLVNEVKPDIILYEITERFINKLPNYNKFYTYQALKNPQAAIIEENTPRIIKRGKSYSIEIVVKNNGDEVWSEDNLNRLCIWQDGVDFGYRIYIPNEIEIKPGEEHTFTLNNFEAPPSNQFYIEYQMVQEGYIYYGEKKRIDITVK